MNALSHNTGRRRRVLAAVLLILCVPPLIALVEAVAYHLQNRSNGALVSSGEEREYLLHVPTSYDATRPTPLVISLHGGAGWPVLQRDLSGWNRIADRDGILVVYPAGLRVLGHGPRGWRVLEPGDGLDRDVRFIADLIDELAATYNIDRARVYVNGLSNGGGMTFVLSCALADRIAAVGTVAAAQMLPWSWCGDALPLPSIAFHGTGDPVVPYAGGTTWVWWGSFPDVEEWTASWARRNRCGTEAIASEVIAGVTRRDYPGCDAPVVLYTIEGAGHTWPGGMPLPEWPGGPNSTAVDATAEMWAFFRAHRRR